MAMFRNVSPVVFLLLVVILLAVTNPSFSDFEQWAYRHLPNFPPSITLHRLLDERLPPFVERRDYALFSLYIVEHGHDRSAWVGVSKRFIRWPDWWPF